VDSNKKQQETTNADRLGAGFISVCLETRWLGPFGGFYVPGPYCREQLPTITTQSVAACVAVCCSVLQCVAACVAVCCNVLQCVAVCCNDVLNLRSVAVCPCNTLQHTATHFNTLQHTATHCNTLQHTAILKIERPFYFEER